MDEPTRDEVRSAILNPLTVTEVTRCRAAAQALAGEPWAAPLLALVGPDTTWTRERAGLLLELRLAGELAGRGITPRYEEAGEGGKSIDFAFEHGGFTWMVEVVGPRASEAVASTLVHDPEVRVWQMSLSSENLDQRQTHGGELIRLQGLIGEKALKFPPVEAGRVHVVFADTRLIGITGVDADDARQLAYGPAKVAAPLVNYFMGQPVRGMFELDTPLRDAARLRQRVHFVLLSGDTAYGSDTLLGDTLTLENPHLILGGPITAVLHSWTGASLPPAVHKTVVSCTPTVAKSR
jgi:hypothetical protein